MNASIVRAAVLSILCSAARADLPAQAPAPSKDIRLHDPSSIVTDAGEAWLFSTGVGIRSYRSTDLTHWKPGPLVFNRPLPWLKDIAPSQKGHLWAPDIIKAGKTYLLYYSVSAFGKQTSAIALATSPTLDPAAPTYSWRDHGIVIRSNPGDPYNAIDPSVMLDGDRLWMAFGSFWNGIFIVELDPLTGKLKDPSSKPLAIAAAPEIEAPFLHKHRGFYYLFVNWGLCCRGADSTYEIRVGRSKSVTGPYLDREGNDLRQAGGTLVLASRGSFVGPGHASIFRDPDGRERLACHYYDPSRRGASFLATPHLHWSADGWPEVPTPRTP